MRPLIACFITAIALTACGNNKKPADSTPTLPAVPTTQAATKAEWIAAADNLCGGANSRIAALRKPTSIAEVAVVGKEVIVINTALLRDLRAVRPPAAEQAAVGALLKKVAAVFDASNRLVQLAIVQKQDAYRKASAALAPLSTAAREASLAYGLKVCGSS